MTWGYLSGLDNAIEGRNSFVLEDDVCDALRPTGKGELLFLDPGLGVPVVRLGLFDVHLVAGVRRTLEIVHHSLLKFTDPQITALVYHRLKIGNTNPALRFDDRCT